MLWCLQQNNFVFLVQLRAETRVNQSFSMKRKFTQWSTFPPISTNTNNHISQSRTAPTMKKKKLRNLTLEIRVKVWDRLKQYVGVKPVYGITGLVLNISNRQEELHQDLDDSSSINCEKRPVTL